MKKYAWLISLIAGLIIIGGAVAGVLGNKDEDKKEDTGTETACVQVVEDQYATGHMYNVPATRSACA